MTTEFIEKNVGILPFLWYSIKAHECLAQLGEHFLDVEGVMGSSPLALTIIVWSNRITMRFSLCHRQFVE